MLESLTDFALLWWEMTGITAAYFFWGAIGGPAFTGIAIACVVNAIVYGAALGILMSLKFVRHAL